MTKETEITVVEEPREAPLMPVAPVQDLVLAMDRFHAVKTALIKPEIDTYESSDGVRIRKSGWRKLALAFGISDEVVQEYTDTDPDDDELLVWHVRVRAWSSRGRTVEGVGTASSRERKFAHPDHDIHALAHTRAKSRAIADMLGSSDKIAEEDPVPVPDRSGTPATKAHEFFDEVLGSELANRCEIRDEETGVTVLLPHSDAGVHGSAFVSRMAKWGYTVKAYPKGLGCELKIPTKP